MVILRAAPHGRKTTDCASIVGYESKTRLTLVVFCCSTDAAGLFPRRVCSRAGGHRSHDRVVMQLYHGTRGDRTSLPHSLPRGLPGDVDSRDQAVLGDYLERREYPVSIR